MGTTREHNRTGGFLVGALLAALAPSCADPPPAFLAYSGGTADASGPARIDECNVAEPRGAVAYVEFQGPTRWVPETYNCVDDEEFAMGHWELDVSTVHLVAGEDLAPDTLIAVEERFAPLGDLPDQGGGGLVSMREAGGQFFVTGWIPASASASGTSHVGSASIEIDLPTAWEELVDEVTRALDPGECSFSDRKLMSEQDFQKYMEEPKDDFCAPDGFVEKPSPPEL